MDPRSRGDRRRVQVAAAVVAAVVGAVGVAAVVREDSTPRRPVVVSTPPALLRARLVLPSTHLRAGGRMSGEVVVDNDTGESIDVAACKVFYAVRLVGDGYRQEVGFLSCAERFVIPVGRSRWPVGVRASFTACGGEPPIRPRCLPDGSMPPIPKGIYRAEVVDGGLHSRPIPVPEPVTITVE